MHAAPYNSDTQLAARLAAKAKHSQPYRYIDTERPWHVRMAQARRWHLRQLTADTRRPPNHAELMAAAADAVASQMPGWTLAPEPTRADVRADYLRVIRRNNPRVVLP